MFKTNPIKFTRKYSKNIAKIPSLKYQTSLFMNFDLLNSFKGIIYVTCSQEISIMHPNLMIAPLRMTHRFLSHNYKNGNEPLLSKVKNL